MAQIAAQQSSVVGLNPVVFAACAGGGDSFTWDATAYLLVRNQDASAKTVTVVVPGTKYGQAIPDIPVVIAAGNTAMIGPFPADVVNPTTGNVDLTYSAVTSLSLAVVRG